MKNTINIKIKMEEDRNYFSLKTKMESQVANSNYNRLKFL